MKRIGFACKSHPTTQKKIEEINDLNTPNNGCLQYVQEGGATFVGHYGTQH